MNYLTNMLTGYGCVLVPLKTPAWEARVGWEKSPFFFTIQALYNYTLGNCNLTLGNLPSA